ncbi:hypothetical protein SCLCIDRAFT_1208081 [Scleroderma citrinum Foug A]|uniref:Transcriptional adapter 2 n=1 Tax=Scleroderma citrinum Foug A TaxID=1036808 RepID=A0A0C3AXC1_9AGAM|nr:hypothetical protein SCLCIDRAFT_1208081 [Scleroderma citrinum Foug A]
MTVSSRKREHQPDEIQIVNEPGLQIQCDSCLCDLTHSVRIKCADPVCEPGDGVDICPTCFCAGKEFKKHRRSHRYRVIELHSYPIFSPDWGADEELLLIEGISKAGLGNWQMVAEHVGTRTKEEVEEHYNSVYIDSVNWPLPSVDIKFDIDPDEFHQRKRRRMVAMNTHILPPPKVPPTSAPGVHEIATFLPGRLEFEHELDNEAEELIKDLEFGICLQYGGDQIIEDVNDPDVKARTQMLEERKSNPLASLAGQTLMNGINNDLNGHYPINGDVPKKGPQPKSEETATEQQPSGDEDPNAEEPMQPPPYENDDSIAFKLTLIEMYNQRVAKRHEAKAIMYERGLLEYKKMQAAEKKRLKEEKDIVNRLRPFSRLQTAEDYEVFVADILYEAILRKRIQELQHYRRMGLMTPADIDKYEQDSIRRMSAKANMTRDYYTSERLNQLRAGGSGRESEGRKSHERESTPKMVTGTGPPRRAPAPLNLANSPSLHLLTPAEQTLCSQLRILPKPYLVIKETLVREYARRGGKLRRREARDLVKIDVNKTSRVWDFLVQAGYLKITPDPQPTAPQEPSGPSHASLAISSSKDHSSISPNPASEGNSTVQFKVPFASPTISTSSWPPN